MSDAVLLVAYIRAQAGKEATLKAELSALTVQTREEAGCIQFDVHGTEDPAEFILWEHFADQAAFDAHMDMPYTKQYFAKGLAASTRAVKLSRLVD